MTYFETSDLKTNNVYILKDKNNKIFRAKLKHDDAK